MQVKKVVIILNRIVIGGQATDTIPLAFYLKEEFDIQIFCGQKENDELYAEQLLLKYEGLKIDKLTFLKRTINPIVDCICFFQLIKKLQVIKPNIVHTHGAKPGFLGRMAAKILRVPVILHTYHGHHFHSYFHPIISKLYCFVERKMAQLSSAIIVLSKNQLDEIVNSFKISKKEKTFVIPLGVELQRDVNTDGEVKTLKNKFSIQPNEICIGIVGRIVSIKNIPFFIECAAELLKRKYSCKFFIIGDGEEKDKVQLGITNAGFLFCSNVNEYNNEPFIFTSWQEDIVPWIYFLDIVTLTSLNEGTPFSLIEAQMAGKPVVATNAGAVANTIINNQTGFLIPLNNKDIFVSKLIKLIDGKSLRIEMGNNGMLWAHEQYSKKKEVEKLKALYYSLLEKKN